MIILRVEGGVVHNVEATLEHRDIQVLILDADTEWGDPDRIVKVDEAEVYAALYSRHEVISDEYADQVLLTTLGLEE